jgi:hypothetical protein
LTDQIRDLEARVEVLSGDKDERSELVMLLVRNLLKENKDLRNLVKSLAGFIGEGVYVLSLLRVLLTLSGLGSCLPRLGLSAPQLDAILNRADTDTAYEAFINLKATREMQEANPGIPLGEIRRRASTTKRKRNSADKAQEGSEQTANTSQTPDAPTSAPPSSEPLNSAKRSRPEPAGSPPAPVDNYAYLFPDLDTYANPPRTDTNAGWNFMFPQSTLFDPSSRNLVSDPHGRGYWPGLMYQSSLAGAAGHHPNFTGFGVTVPAPQSQPLSSLAGGAALPPGPPVNYAATHPPAAPTSLSTPERAGMTEEERQRHLREAVAKMTYSGSQKQTSVGLAMTAEEIEQRRMVQRELIQSMEEAGGGVMAESMQLIAYHLNK